MSDSLEGYVQNVQTINEDTFSFEVQGESSSERVVCFKSPVKRKLVESRVKSPVKLNNIKISKKTNDWILEDDSIIKEIDDLDFEPLNYENLSIEKLNKVAVGSTFSLCVKIDTRHSKTVHGKKVDIFGVSDSSGQIKFSSWEHAAGNPTLGMCYELNNVRLKKDNYGNLELVTPKLGFSISKSSKVIDAACQITNNAVVPITGEIFKINSIGKYLICVNCHKKIQEDGSKIVKCVYCKNSMKKKFCDNSLYVKFTFMSDDNKKIDATIFKNELLSLIPEVSKMNEEEIKDALISFDELLLTLTEKNIVNFVKTI